MRQPRQTEQLNSYLNANQNNDQVLSAKRIVFYAALLILLSGVVLGVGLMHLRDEAIKTGIKLTQSMAYSIEEQVSRTLQTTDQRLQLAAVGLQTLKTNYQLNDTTAQSLLHEHEKDFPFLKDLQVLDQKGKVIFDSNRNEIGLTHQAQEHFQIYQKQPVTEFHISVPVQNPLTSAWVINTSRPLRSSTGEVIGVIVAYISLSYFEQLWQDMDLGANSSIGLFRSDGMLMLRSPVNDAAMGKYIGTFGPFSVLLTNLAKSPNGSFQSRSLIDQVQRYNAYRTLSFYPHLVINVGRSNVAVLASWTAFAQLAALIWLLAVMSVLFLSFLVWRSVQQKATTELRFLQLAQSMPQIVFITTASGGLIFISQQWCDLTGQQTELARKGAWFEMIHPEDCSGVAKHIEAILKSGHGLPHEYRVRCKDGSYRWFLSRGTANRDSSGHITSWFATATDIDDLKQANIKLLSQTRLLHKASTLAKLAGWTFEIGTMHMHWSDEATALFGLPAGSVLTLESGLNMCTPKCQGLLQQAWRDCLQHGTPFDLELEIILLDGNHCWVRSIGQAVADAKGVVCRIEGAFMDISTSKHDAFALIESEQRFTALFDAAPVSMIVINKAYDDFLAINDAAIQTYGYSREDLKLMTPFDLVAPDDRYRIAQMVQSGFPMNTVQFWRHRRKDGSEFSVELIRRAIRHGNQDGVIVVSFDITARVKAEQQVMSQLQTLQRTTEAAVEITGHQTLEPMIKEIAERARTVIGAQLSVIQLVADKHLTKPIRAMSLSRQYANLPAADNPFESESVNAVIGTFNSAMRLTRTELEAHPRWESLSRHAEKVPHTWGYLIVPLTDHEGRNIGSLQLAGKYDGDFTQIDEYVATQLAQLASSAIDNVTLLAEIKELNSGLEDKVAQRTSELAHQEALFRALAEQAPQPIWTVDLKGAATFVSHAYYLFSGCDHSAWEGYNWLDLVHPDDVHSMSKNWVQSVKTQKPFTGIRRMRFRDGTYRTMSYKATLVFNEKQEPIFWVGIDTDITDFKAVETALRLTNRELESFSYSVSHDLRMPLNTIEGFSQLLVKELQEVDGNGKRYIDRIQYAVRQMSQLIEGLLSLAQVTRLDMLHEPNDLSALANEILINLQSAHPRRHVSYTVEPGLQAYGDSRLIRSVMDNLLSNAWKFSSRREQADITVGRSIKEDAFFVRDNGAGFDMAYSDKLFGTFQRLHAVKEFPGTGIGLATVARIINRHGGEIWAESAPNQGATFFFRLPSNMLYAVEEAKKDFITTA